MQTHDVEGDHGPEGGRAAPARERQGDPGPVTDARPPDTLRPDSLQRLQRAAGNAAVGALLGAEPAEESPVKAIVRSSGTPLDRDTRRLMESRLGQDFSDVRLHTDAPAAASAKSVQAQAYTVENHIVFGEGRYVPGSPETTRTLAHELTHVVQQRSGPVDGTPAPGGIQVSDPSDRFERDAERSADQVMAAGHDRAPAGGAGGGPGAALQRQEEAEEEVQELSAQRQEQDEEEVQELSAQRQEEEGPALEAEEEG